HCHLSAQPPHRALHPFPTRRSSDLAALVTPQVWPNAVSYRLALSVWKTSPPETGTGTGVALPVVVPLPSSPSLLSPQQYAAPAVDRKSTRLNSSHQIISYAVFCL